MKNSREHILLTSLALFLQKNYKEVTLKEIVEKTAMSKGAFYHYFSSKEQVFEEVISHFFSGMMTLDFSKLPQTSLKDFYTAILDKAQKDKMIAAKSMPVQTDGTLSNNYFYLIFDAMRILPDFKQQHLEEQKQELKAWKKVIAVAKKSYEIKTEIGDEQLAKLFIYLGDGTNINLIVGEKLNDKKNELKTLWNALYESIKTPV